MDLEYSEDEHRIADSLQRALAGEDRVAVARRAAATDVGFEEAERLALARGGWLRLAFDTERGGIGPGGVGTMLLGEACGRNLVTSPWLPDAIMAGGVLAEARRCAGEAASERLEAILDGAERIALATFEGDDDLSDRLATEAVALAGGGFRIDGTKSRVLAAAGVNALIVSATVRAEGGSTALFLVAADSPGLEVAHERMIDGRTLSRVVLSDVKVPRSARVDDGANGAALLSIARDRALLAAAAENLGAMQVLFDATLGHVRTREQFGQPIGRFQALQHRLVDLSIRLDEARALVTAAAIAVDESLAPGASPPEASGAVAAAWVQSLWSGRQIVEESIQMHGAIGMTDEYALGHYAKRIVLNEAFFGGAESHLTRFAALTAPPSAARAVGCQPGNCEQT
ncbi:MAG: hypothetical protein KJZ83_21035 [Burkholderiaceae bacterium]|nr:hypothetical protein [Burkholderiaceae bacterium]